MCLNLPAMPIDDTPPPFTPMLPASYGIPVQLIEGWLALPQTAYVEPRLTRLDWDHLFTAINKITDAQIQVNNTIINWTNGNTLGANQALFKSQKSIIKSQNSLRMFFAAILASATKGSAP